MTVRNEQGQFSTPEQIARDFLKAKGKPKQMKNELGRNYSQRMGGGLYDDFLPQLRGNKAAKIYREMSDNDATVGAILFAVDMELRRLEWSGEAASDDAADVEAAEFLNEAISDMTHSFNEHISSALSMLPFGFAPFEVVYRQRSEKEGSRFDDKKWGWRKFGFRPQETIIEFLMDDKGGYSGILQQTEDEQVEIPIEKLIVYRTTTMRGPEGRSMLRNAYRSWFFKKRVEELVVIGVERDLAGMPIAYMPAKSIIEEDDSYSTVKTILERLKRDEQEGLIWPGDRDETGNRFIEIELLGGGSGNSSRLAQAEGVARSFAQDIAATVLADFIGLGRDAVGSRALAEPKQELFKEALEAWADVFAETLNRHTVPKLMELNGMKGRARIVHSPIITDSLTEIAQFINQTTAAGMDWFGGDAGEATEAKLRQMAGFDPEDLESLFKGMKYDEFEKRWLSV